MQLTMQDVTAMQLRQSYDQCEGLKRELKIERDRNLQAKRVTKFRDILRTILENGLDKDWKNDPENHQLLIDAQEVYQC